MNVAVLVQEIYTWLWWCNVFMKVFCWYFKTTNLIWILGGWYASIVHCCKSWFWWLPFVCRPHLKLLLEFAMTWLQSSWNFFLIVFRWDLKHIEFLFSRVFQLSCNLLMCWTYSHCKRHLQPNRLGNLWCNDRNWRIIYQWLPNSNQRVSQLLPFVSSSCSIIAGFGQFIFFFLWPFMHTRMYHVKL